MTKSLASNPWFNIAHFVVDFIHYFVESLQLIELLKVRRVLHPSHNRDWNASSATNGQTEGEQRDKNKNVPTSVPPGGIRKGLHTEAETKAPRILPLNVVSFPYISSR
mmetsp:Transcript_27722/g.108726  ORF Transcript_27722/g.108726 Transcript_27722/m.108726 type:complete len:108 (-) Transcript_27722:14-337(-)